MPLSRIVSGGQTGVDRGALDAALDAGFSCGGWCPQRRLAEDGAIAVRYPLMETTGGDYSERTLRNVLDSDGTAILYCGEPGAARARRGSTARSTAGRASLSTRCEPRRRKPPRELRPSLRRTTSARSTSRDRARASGPARATTLTPRSCNS